MVKFNKQLSERKTKMADLIEKEQEYRLQNEQLERKTKELFHKVDEAMKRTQVERCIETSNTSTLNHELNSNILTTELNLPKCVDEMGRKGMIHFYKMKVKTLQAELQKIDSELKNKNEEIKKQTKSNQTLVDEKEKWFLQCNAEKTSNNKLEKQLKEIGAKLQIKENENMSLKKENEQLKTQIKSTSNELRSSEEKIKRTILDLEKTKTAVKTLRDEQKESHNSYKSTIKDLCDTVKRIEKHKSELLQGYKKQAQLIENLKKQKLHIESCKVVELGEEEFSKLLDWNLN